MPVLALVFSLCLAGCQDTFPHGLNEDLGFSSLVFVKRSPPKNAGSLVAQIDFRPGGNIVMLNPATPRGEVIELTDLEAGDVNGIDISPDGLSILSSIRTDLHDRFHIYRIEIESIVRGNPCFLPQGDVGPACTRLTFGPANDIEPFHLPDGRIAFLREDPAGQVDFQGRGRSRILYAVLPDGSGLERLDMGPGHVFGAAALKNGRLQLVRWTQREGSPVFQPLSIDPVGVLNFLLDGPRGQAVVPINPVQDNHGRLFAACVPFTGTWGSGTICQRDDLGGWTAILPNIPAGSGCSPDGRIRDPFPLADGRFIVSYANVPQGCLNIEDGDRGLVPDFAIAILNPDDGARLPLFNSPQASNLWPSPVVKRSLLDPGITLPPPPGGCGSEGILIEGYVVDADQVIIAEAARIRVIEGLSGQLAPWDMAIGGNLVGALCSLGSVHEAPVFDDGSFRFRAPNSVPLKIQVIDHYGAVLKTDPFWRGGPLCSTRKCSGCHAFASGETDLDQSLAALAIPVDFSDRAGQHSYDFRRDIQPILDSSCSTQDCHDSQTSAGAYVSLSGSLIGLDLSNSPSGRTNIAYQNLLMVDRLRNSQTGKIIEERRPYVVPGSAQQSRLAQRLGIPCRYDCSGLPAWASWALGQGQTHPEDQPGWTGTFSDEDRWKIVEWIDVGAPFLGRGATP
ncbi:MAG: hypothetical protein JRJ87_04385 [Deltaproteobacteria bacterium]|nr:hypothetical protein [Deltaproteobacteria bacterium]